MSSTLLREDEMLSVRSTALEILRNNPPDPDNRFWMAHLIQQANLVVRRKRHWNLRRSA